MIVWHCFAWLPMVAIGIINGVIREKWYTKSNPHLMQWLQDVHDFY